MKNNIILYVATDGDDSLDGLSPERHSGSGPLATIKRARDTVRRIREERGTDAPPAAVTVRVRGGKYRLGENIQLFERDGGDRDFPVRYENFKDEKPVLSGGIRIKGWKKFRGGIWRVSLPKLKGGRVKSRQLFFNGERMPRARFPKGENEWLFVERPEEEREMDSFHFHEGDIPKDLSLRNAEIVMYPHAEFINNISPIAEYLPEDRFIRLETPGKDLDIKIFYWPSGMIAGNRYFFENVLDALCEPGEWVLDGEDGYIYFMPPKGLDPNQNDVTLPMLNNLISVRFAKYVTISGFTLTETADGENTHPHGQEGLGAFFPMPGLRYGGTAVLVRDSEEVKIEKCRFDQVGCNAVYLLGSDHRCRISGCEIERAGANGVCVSGVRILDPDSRFYSGRYNGHGVGMGHPTSCEITDCHISWNGRINKYSQAIITGICDSLLIAHNLIEHSPGMAIQLGVNGYGRSVVEYNRIRHAGHETNDDGAIHFWMEDELDPVRNGHVIRYNYISDVSAINIPRRESILYHCSIGIYIDNLASGNFVYGNIIARVEGMGIILQGGKNNVIENNIIYDCTSDPQNREQKVGLFQAAGGFDIVPHLNSGNRFYKNIISQSGQTMVQIKWANKNTFSVLDENLYWNFNGLEPLFLYHTKDVKRMICGLNEWKALGFDRDGIFADPLFIDPDHGDFSFAADSPALRMGILPVDMSHIGIRLKFGYQ